MKKLKSYLYCLFLSLIFIGLASKNSPLYQFNDWVDANAFFTVGKAMVRGIVPYQELFEQKGPILYFIYGLGSLISYQSFFGVFIIEVIFFAFFLYYAYKTLLIFTNKKTVYFILPIISLLVVTLKSFTHGGSAEEFTLPLLMYSFYNLVNYLTKENSSQISIKELLINGFIAGCVLLLKYTLLGFWFGFMLIIIIRLIKDKKYQEIILKSLTFLLGLLIAWIPWLIYFGINNALKDFFEVYFLINIKLYPSKMSFMLKLRKTLSLIIKNLFGIGVYFFFIVGGFVLLTKKKRKKTFYLIIPLLTSALFIYIGGTNYHYYPLILAPFILVGIIALVNYELKISVNKYNLLINIIICLIALVNISDNVMMLSLKKDDYAQYRFAKLINKDDTLLNFGFLDGGFYTISGIIPDSYYFMKTNIPYQNYPKMLDEQVRYITEEKVLYIVAKESNTLKKYRTKIEKHYLLVDEFTQNYQNKKTTYFLYKRQNKS